MCEDVPRCENIKKDVRKLSDIWFPEHFKVYNAYWNRPKTVKHLALSPNGKDNNSTSDKSKTKKSFVVSFRSPEVAGTATSRDRLLQQGSGADRAHVLRRSQVIRLITLSKWTPAGRPFFYCSTVTIKMLTRSFCGSCLIRYTSLWAVQCSQEGLIDCMCFERLLWMQCPALMTVNFPSRQA